MEKEIEYERPELEEYNLEIEGSFLMETTDRETGGDTEEGGDDGWT